MKKILILMLFCFTFLIGCSSNKSEVKQEEEFSKVSTILGNEEVGFYELEGNFKDISGVYDFLVYKNDLGIVVTIKKFDSKFEEKDIEYIDSLTKTSLKNVCNDNIVTNISPFIMVGGLADGHVIKGAGTVNGLVYNMDVYLYYTKNNETIYISIEGFEQFYDIEKYTKYLMDDFFISEI